MRRGYFLILITCKTPLWTICLPILCNYHFHLPIVLYKFLIANGASIAENATVKQVNWAGPKSKSGSAKGFIIMWNVRCTEIQTENLLCKGKIHPFDIIYTFHPSSVLKFSKRYFCYCELIWKPF